MLRLREAGLEDLALLRRWDAAPHVVAAKGTEDWGWEHELACRFDWREQLIAVADDVPIGFVQIMDPAREPSRYWGECPAGLRAIDIWIGAADYLGRGFGTTMMTQAIERCFADPAVEGILIDPLASNVRARRFYERLGFTLAPEWVLDDDSAVYRLARAAWQRRERAGM